MDYSVQDQYHADANNGEAGDVCDLRDGEVSRGLHDVVVGDVGDNRGVTGAEAVRERREAEGTHKDKFYKRYHNGIVVVSECGQFDAYGETIEDNKDVDANKDRPKFRVCPNIVNG
ncbi:hypothetical protein NW762_010977 [Fusarium torreyae]|uniref:Uncharacterized protein n=1 Tax=Fusarium torreyae TaxID=1237075 RepID=A0A9W8RU36_9HYPO|nr:hypothetical protein NW762_010977 [Fusarium torreyae]